MDWQPIAVWVTVAVAATAAVRYIVLRLRGKCDNPCCGCDRADCPGRREGAKL